MREESSSTRQELETWKRISNGQKKPAWNRRRFLKIASVPATLLALAGAGKLANNIIDSSALDQFTTRQAMAQQYEPQEESSEERPYRFLPGKTAVDLTRVNIRTSPEVINEPSTGESNRIDRKKIKLLEGIINDKDAKTMYIENALLISGDSANGDFIIVNAVLENGSEEKVYINYGHNKEIGAVAAEADETGKSGFIEGTHGIIPRLNQEPSRLSLDEMNKISFSETKMMEPSNSSQ